MRNSGNRLQMTSLNLLVGRIMLNVVVGDVKPFQRVLNGSEPYYESIEEP